MTSLGETKRRHTSNLLRRVSPLFAGGCIALATANAKAEELRIGYVAPTTGISPVGKTWSTASRCISTRKQQVRQCQMRIHRRGRTASPTPLSSRPRSHPAITAFLVGGLLALTVSSAQLGTAEKVLYVNLVAAADDLAARLWPNIRTTSAPAGRRRSRATRSANGLRVGQQKIVRRRRLRVPMRWSVFPGIRGLRRAIIQKIWRRHEGLQAIRSSLRPMRSFADGRPDAPNSLTVMAAVTRSR